MEATEILQEPAGSQIHDIFDEFKHQLPDTHPDETQEWIDSLDALAGASGPERARFVLYRLLKRARMLHIGLPPLTQTRYINTISPEQEPPFPGDEGLELSIRRMLRWNAVAMVLRANEHYPGIGGHIATYASSASLYEVGMNHFFHGKDAGGAGDQIFFQGHAAPGIYAQAFLEGRLTEDQLDHFRREVTPGQGLSSYPHPRLMPDFWEFPTVSMGLGPISAIYQARFNRYLKARGIADTGDSRVRCFLGDGEYAEPEALGAMHAAASQGPNNLIFVVNCNLQRLDGPVRGNGKIVQELEAVFRGSGWNVIKVLWAREWDDLFARDVDGVLLNRVNEVLDGDLQRFSVESGAYIREHFFGPDPRLRKLVEDMSDEQLRKLRRGGHDYRKVYAAYHAAVKHKGSPTVIFAQTVKGWTLGPHVEGRNVTHQAKKLSLDDLRCFRDRIQAPIPDSKLSDIPYYHPGAESPEIQYLLERRRTLGGFLPKRVVRPHSVSLPEEKVYAEFAQGSGKVAVSTTMAFVRLLRNLIYDPNVGRRVVPIIPDEARTFGMDPLFKEIGIYSPLGQRYTPVDAEYLLSYREAVDGQILEEGITEAGAMASFTAAGTSYATLGSPVIPFYMFYSMFGFQRTGDQIWAFGDARGRGFLIGGTAGRTTLNGEGLQHEDGHSHLLASTIPNICAYDPAFAYETAVIVKEGIRRMLQGGEDVFYYLTLYNENYPMPPMPDGAEEGILSGLYLLRPAAQDLLSPKVTLLGSGAILKQALRAQDLLARFGIGADVWSVTSYQLLRKDALSVERWNRLHPDSKPRSPYVARMLEGKGPVVAVSDYLKTVPDQIARWAPQPFLPLGTDGFGRSDTREALRRHFEVDAEHIAQAAVYLLAKGGQLPPESASEAFADFGIDPEAPDPAAV
ncbi:MAG: pyruvate dehydrogenase (acetyl-transferring), homodimeric type [Armatimonadetes bacterium]|nr:pyruvate dehydrogenase (acetyl-transferring), homodimeric type [Armatimonadota bacterium]